MFIDPSSLFAPTSRLHGDCSIDRIHRRCPNISWVCVFTASPTFVAPPSGIAASSGFPKVSRSEGTVDCEREENEAKPTRVRQTCTQMPSLEEDAGRPPPPLSPAVRPHGPQRLTINRCKNGAWMSGAVKGGGILVVIRSPLP